MRRLLATAIAALVLLPVGALAQEPIIGELEGVTVLIDLVPAKYNEAPDLAAKVAAGELPPIEERVGPEPLVIRPIHEIGVYGGTWRRGFIGPNDIANATRAVLHDRILYWNYDESEIVPNIAKAWEVSEDGKVTTIHLRKGMKWSDGHPFTADDFVFWYEDMALYTDLLPQLPPELRVAGKPVKIVKVDETTVQYISEVPYFTLPIKLSSTSNLGGHGRWGYVGWGGFAPAHYLKQIHPKYAGQEAVDAMAKAAGFDNWTLFFLERNSSYRNTELPVITAWKTVRPITGDVWEYERNPYSIWMDEAGNQLPYIDRIVMTKGEDLEVINLRAIAGAYDWQERHIDLTKLPVLLENAAAGNYSVYLDTSSMGGEAYICANMSYAADPELGKLLASVDFRRALSLGIDRDAINEVLFLGLGTPGSIAPAEGSLFSPGPDSEWRTKWSTYDVDQANALLDGLGLTERNADGVRLMANGQPLRVELMTYLSFMDFTALGEMMAEDYRDLGILLHVVEMERTATQTRRRANEHHLTIDVTWGAENIFGHPTELWPNAALGCAGPEYGKYIASQGKEGTPPPEAIAKVEELYQLATQSPPEKRLEIGKEIWRIILENQWAIGTVGLSPAIQGVRVVNKNMGNIPARQLNDANVENPGNSRPEQFYFKS